MEIPIDWLLEGESWIRYRVYRDLLEFDETDEMVVSERSKMLTHPFIVDLMTELSNWPGQVISSHKSAGQQFHKLTFLSDLGVKYFDPGMDVIISKIMQHQSVEGPFQLPVNIPTHFGGTGQVTWGWALCDAPLTLYSLINLGLEDHPKVHQSADYLINLIRENGWPCAVSKELGTFRGPGRKNDPCPYATLAMLKALSIHDDYRDSQACKVGAGILLDLWKNSMTQHPYIFYMGNDFRKLKLPFVWYDLLHVLDVLTNFTWLRSDSRLLEMVELLKGKADSQGCFTPESIWTAWKGWEFCQKKSPSRWMTLLAWRIIKRIE
jgi:hypothetical protein